MRECAVEFVSTRVFQIVFNAPVMGQLITGMITLAADSEAEAILTCQKLFRDEVAVQATMMVHSMHLAHS